MENLTNVCEATSQSHDLDNFRPIHRKGKKLLAEKKRRARINNCLMQIRRLVCEGQEENDADVDKMEKAEILERTLEVLTRLRHDKVRSSSTASTRKAMAIRYASGFSSCAEESIRYIQNSRLVPPEVKVQLQSHLRAIARRMETIVQADSSQSFPSCSSSSSMSPPERLAVPGAERTCVGSSSRVDTMQNQQQIDQGSEVRGYYIGSPIHTSTPDVAHHQSHNHHQHHHLHVLLTPQLDQELKPTNYINETFTETSQQTKPNFNSHASDIGINMKQKFSHSDPGLHHPQRHPTELFQVKPCLCPQTSLSCQSSFCQSKSSYLSSVNSPSFLQSPALLHTTPIIPEPMYAYYGYEPFPTIPCSLVQTVQPINSPSLSSGVVKEPSTPSNALDLCVKRTEDQQISPETMWRPW